MDKLETNLNTKCKDIDCLLEQKVKNDCFNQLNERIKFLKNFKQDFETSLLMLELYEKRLNILIHDISENHDTP